MEILPVVVPGITIPTNVLPLFEITMAEVPPIVKVVGLFNSVPLMVTRVPIEPEVGVKDVITGWANTWLLQPKTNRAISRFRRENLNLFMGKNLKLKLLLKMIEQFQEILTFCKLHLN
jgi:hypothetical protein